MAVSGTNIIVVGSYGLLQISNIGYPKINRNVERDIENQKKLTDMGWKVLIVWECELKKTSQKERLEKLCNEIIS